MSDIVFVNPPLTLEERYGKLSGAGNTLPSLGLCWLAAACRRNGFRARIIDAAAMGLDHETALKEIFKERPRAVGITATTCAVHSAAKLAKMIKGKDKGIATILGGAHLTAVSEKTMESFPEFDTGIIGEGEETIVELLNAGNDKKELSGIKGMIFREDDRLYKTEKRPFIKDLDGLPFPAWDLLKGFPAGYKPPAFRFQALPASYLVTSRGCPMRCTFCDRSVFGYQYRFFSTDYVFDMIMKLKNAFGVREILFEDDSLTVHKTRLASLCEKIIRKRVGISWSCLGRVDMVDEELLRLMKKAGCWQIGYGIESGNPGILDSVQKKIDLEQVTKALRLTKKAGIKTKGFFILGLPMETSATIRESISFAKKAALDDVAATLFTPFPGSKIYESATRFGAFDDDWKRMNLMECVFVPNGLTSDVLKGYAKRFFREFYFRPKIVFSYGMRVARNPAYSGKIFQGLFAFLKNAF